MTSSRKCTDRNPVEIFDDTEELVESLIRIADRLPAEDAYWLRESAVSLLGMYEDLKEQAKALRKGA